MFDIPLHPVLVHIPMALTAILPFAAFAALAAGRRQGQGGRGRKYWAAVVALQALLTISSFFALQAGQRDEERVEKAVSEAPLESHEEKGETFMQVTAAGLVVAALGLAPGMLGTTGRVAGGLVSLVILFLGVQVGHSGGQLVYKHGAASAFTGTNGAGTVAENGAAGAGEAGGKAAGEAGKEGVGAKDEDD